MDKITEKQIDAEIAERVKADGTPIDREARFSDMIDELYSFDSVGGPFACMTPSKVLLEMDPVAFRCGVNDYEDSEGWIEIDGEYYDRKEVGAVCDDFADDVESEADDLECDEDADAGAADLLREKADYIRNFAD